MNDENHGITGSQPVPPTMVESPGQTNPETDQAAGREIIYCESIIHLGRKWVKLDIGDDFPVIKIKKLLPSLHWRAGPQDWLMPWRENWLAYLQAKLDGLAEVTDASPPNRRVKRHTDGSRPAGRRTRRSSVQSPALPPEYLELLRQRNYSEATIRVYVSHFNLMLAHTGHRPPQELGPAEIKAYLEYLSGEKGASKSYRTQALSAIKFYYGQVLVPPREI
ncbi:phage integrase N-terminal SAM-like domain-containing protein [candidate division TA06 bacterium]|uniref:Phage integrase N-terminal SAM-like domain-containing protein n=1 Tax=candidate division TA06 bacterium TaxID=2250710 RepID=A0A933ML04_UNCT6|nr:phage integrase N-terminal SAM-like domain-containing protein [candidate division TA06 bacterium]